MRVEQGHRTGEKRAEAHVLLERNTRRTCNRETAVPLSPPGSNDSNSTHSGEAQTIHTVRRHKTAQDAVLKDKTI